MTCCLSSFGSVIKSFSANMSKHCKNTTCSKKNPGISLSNTPKTTDDSPKKRKAAFEVLPTPIKSESDKKDYKVIRLANGLTACLISDTAPIDPEEEMETESETEDEVSGSEPESDGSESDEEPETKQKMAAAGLCIGVGSFSDPKDVPGMAHFLEHMVFMGSKKFPKENDFDAFIKKSGGSDNASTDAETTVFYFECLEKFLYEALDKFAQFFIEPLMKKEAIQREREAIESEFQMSLPSDSSRRDQLLASLAKENSPVNSFSWGNLITLKDNISDDKLYKGVHDFRLRHYSSHRMTLAIQARLPLETLQDYVVDCFSKVPNNSLSPDDFTEFSKDIFNTEQFKRIYYIKPISDACQLELTWPLPSMKQHYKTKPEKYLSSLLGDEGKGSILSYLRKKVWVMSTAAGTSNQGSEDNSLFSLFKLTMIVTSEGLNHIYEIIETVYAYINLLKKVGPQERLFKEFSMIADTSFRFSTEETASDTVENLCEEMQFYSSENYLTGQEIFNNYDPELIKNYTNYLSVDNMNIVILSKTIPDNLKFDKKEKWFGTEYTDVEIPKEWTQKWDKVEPYPELNLPPPNPYLTTDFTILAEKPNNPNYPIKVSSSTLYELYYRQDQKFKLPIGYYYFQLISPLANDSATSSCMLYMLQNLLVIAITEELYPAQNADLNYEFVIGEKGLVLKVSGYNEKLPILVESISKYIENFDERIDQNMFEAVKDLLGKYFYNYIIKPSSVASKLRIKILVNNCWTNVEKYDALKTITFDMVKKYVKDYFKCLYVKGLVQGNVSQDIAVKTLENFVKTLKITEFSQDLYPKFRVIQLPKGEHCCRLYNFNKNDSNSIITNYYQSNPFTFHESVIIELLMLIIEEPVFDILRTKEQLGYHVYCSLRTTFGILGYTITVNAQATKHSTQYVDERIEEFIKYSKELLDDLTEEQFEQSKSSLIKIKQCVDVHLKEEVDRNWSEMTDDEYIFDRLNLEINEIKTITLNDLKEWWKRHNLFGDKENFRKLSIQVVGFDINDQSAVDDLLKVEPVVNLLGSTEAAVKEKKPEGYFIQNIKTFQENQYLYPVIDLKKQ